MATRKVKVVVECPHCESGIIEVLMPCRSPTQEEPEYGTRECEECDGTGVAACQVCGADARPMWTAKDRDTGDRYYCSRECYMSENRDEYLAELGDRERDRRRDDAATG